MKYLFSARHEYWRQVKKFEDLKYNPLLLNLCGILLLTYLAVEVDLTRVERPTSGLELLVDGVSLLDDFKSVLAGTSLDFVVAGEDSFGLRKALTPGGGSLIVNCCLGTGRSFGVSKVIFSFTGDFSGTFGILFGVEGLLSNIRILSETGVETMLEMRDMLLDGVLVESQLG